MSHHTSKQNRLKVHPILVSAAPQVSEKGLHRFSQILSSATPEYKGTTPAYHSPHAAMTATDHFTSGELDSSGASLMHANLALADESCAAQTPNK